ncbi:succinylglutamate desuccinylase/aspartoacylase family protein [Ekhidna sp.]|uniref:succinylglutamate desuccinylase/aspartoacylase family protein n=1 Tax=Ekhidna sp. TaxID=2608089 RepID=UPI003BAD64F1
MINVHSKALNQDITVNRIIANIKGEQAGPTLIFVGGIHGNEPAGVFALQRVAEHLTSEKINLNGNIICLAGNLRALKKGIRYHKEDLNRVWTKDRISHLPESTKDVAHEEIAEQIEIYAEIQKILKSNTGPFYFFDIHTTSSETLPFLTVNDSLLNRAYTSQYPLPMILGIEEYLNGPILSYINELGYVAFGFEAGQHDDLSSIENAEAFCYLSMVFTGVLSKDDIAFQHYFDLLAKTTGDIKYVYEIYFRYLIKNGEKFAMEPGFFNFQRVHKNQLVAISNGKEVRAKTNGRIFMPLYQDQGVDGFFAIRRIRRSFLRLSEKLRKLRADRILAWLPGIKWVDPEKSTLLVNKRVARFLAKDVLHLFGYRQIYRDKYELKMINREAKARTEDYQDTSWLNL